MIASTSPRFFSFFSSSSSLSSLSSNYWQKTNSRMVVFQPLFIYIRLFGLHVHFCAAASQWDVKESKGTQFLIISTSLNCFFFSLPFAVVYRLNLFNFFFLFFLCSRWKKRKEKKKKSLLNKILLRAYFAYQANRSFLSILLHFDLNKLPIERCLSAVLCCHLCCAFSSLLFAAPASFECLLHNFSE